MVMSPPAPTPVVTVEIAALSDTIKSVSRRVTVPALPDDRVSLVTVADWLSRMLPASIATEPAAPGPEVSKPIFDFEEKKIIEPGYEPAITTGQIERILDLYQRYEVSLENRFLKLVRELKVMRAEAA